MAIADHADNTLAVTFRYHTGPKILLGDVRVEGSHKTKTSYLQKLRSWKDGEVYSPEAIEKFTVRASDTGVFDSVTARVAPAPAPDCVLADVVDGLSPAVVRAVMANTIPGFGPLALRYTLDLAVELDELGYVAHPHGYAPAFAHHGLRGANACARAVARSFA